MSKPKPESKPKKKRRKPGNRDTAAARQRAIDKKAFPPMPHIRPGAPTKFSKRICEVVYKLMMLGASQKEMADILDIDEDTFRRWKNEKQEFYAALKAGGDLADAHMASKLYHRGIGYEHPEEKIFSNDGVITRVMTTRHYPPDTGAALTWLKNRQPEKWKDKVEHDHRVGRAFSIPEQEPRKNPEMPDKSKEIKQDEGDGTGKDRQAEAATGQDIGPQEKNEA